MTLMARWFVVSSTLLVVIALSGVQAICEDSINDCADYEEGTCKTYPVWANTYCKSRCNLCIEKECADGWTIYEADKTCSKVFGSDDRNVFTTWDDARQKCNSQGGDLVIIKDEKKNDFVFGLLGSVQSYWIGMKNMLETKEKKFDFQYVDGLKMGDFHPWLPGNPDNYNGGEKCVTIYVKEGFNKQWNDDSCWNHFPYVCSISL